MFYIKIFVKKYKNVCVYLKKFFFLKYDMHIYAYNIHN